MDGPRRSQSISYVAFKSFLPALDVAVGTEGHINADATFNARNWHVAFDAAGAGNVAWSRCCDTRRRKSESTGNTNFDLNRRASLRPYLREVGVKVLDLLTCSPLRVPCKTEISIIN